ncbi:uncharacterized protein N7483_012323 [Penicillium malachiteum]|uniref:uncharacterized protein n=1 Tax=Penicillium malachiteum TaxID=1324776 RepID=UPI002547E662|nr:uncharacterized protein N7483_012323 [Penicillium malachiteum]KAJ5715142.1 hypothetical protein N7483_012323 [Penicillium malachiteum]
MWELEECLINGPPLQSAGIPDMVIINQRSSLLLVVELKTPWIYATSTLSRCPKHIQRDNFPTTADFQPEMAARIFTGYKSCNSQIGQDLLRPVGSGYGCGLNLAAPAKR